MKQQHLLDTHIIIWWMMDDNRLDGNIRYDIDYYQRSFCTSTEVIKEMVLLQALGKIDPYLEFETVLQKLEEKGIEVYTVEIKHIRELSRLPLVTDEDNGKLHGDPVDRMIIAQSISMKCTLVSADHIFHQYRKYGLKLLVN